MILDPGRCGVECKWLTDEAVGHAFDWLNVKTARRAVALISVLEVWLSIKIEDSEFYLILEMSLQLLKLSDDLLVFGIRVYKSEEFAILTTCISTRWVNDILSVVLASNKRNIW